MHSKVEIVSGGSFNIGLLHLSTIVTDLVWIYGERCAALTKEFVKFHNLDYVSSAFFRAAYFSRRARVPIIILSLL